MRPALAFRMMYPDSRISFLCDAGKGHFDFSETTQRYIARFIEKSLENPRPEEGVLYSRWYVDGTESTDPHDCFWYQDKEMVDMTKAIYASSRGKKLQYLGAKINGNVVPLDTTKHIKMNARVSGTEFTVEPYFCDVDRKLTRQHARVKPRVVLISGPAIQTGECTFRIDDDYFGKDPKRLWTGITVCLEADGDADYKSAVQEINIQLSNTVQ